MDFYKNRILVVNDNDGVRHAFLDRLATAGYENVDCDDGSDAEYKLIHGGYDLLIQDLERPGRNGFELYFWLKTQEALSNVPIVLATVSCPIYMQETRTTVIAGIEFKGTFRVDFEYSEAEFGARPQYIAHRPALFVEGYCYLGSRGGVGHLLHALEEIFNRRAAVKDINEENNLRSALLWPVVLKLFSGLAVKSMSQGTPRED